MAANRITQLERVRYWQGQLLASGDLETQMRVVADLRRQHNRAVHRAYGIAIGLAVGEIVDGKAPVSCGLAYDCSGRELPVWEDTTVAAPKPAITVPTLLTITYDAGTGQPLLGWRPQSAPVSTDGVAIARILPGPPVAIDTSFRPVIARPMARPRIAAGQTVPGDTPWNDWEDQAGVSIGVQTVVDTSAAGFTTTPNYFAEAVTDKATADFQPAWFTSIADAAPNQFTLRLFLRRITREALQIVDPKVQVAATPAVGGPLTIASGNVFSRYDQVSRLLPIAESASIVTTLSGNNATLDAPLPSFTATGPLTFGNPPRLAKVVTVGAAGTVVQITVDTPGNFAAGNVVVKLGPAVGMARPTTVTAIDDQGVIELANPIQGLATNDTLGVVQLSSPVTAVAGTSVTVQNPASFQVNGIVVSMDTPVENFPPAQVMGIAGNVLTLSAAIPGLSTTSSLGAAQMAGTVQTVDVTSSEVKVDLDSVKVFRAGDLVARVLGGGAFTEPVRVQSVQSNKKRLTLSKAIPGLGAGDQIGAADFRVRATVLAASGTTVTVADATLFPAGSFVAMLDDTYTPAGSSLVLSSSGKSVVLTAAIAGLAPGQILALCSFPTMVTVQSIASDGTISVDAGGVIRAGDVVAAIPAHPGIATVAAASGQSIQLANAIAGLAANDTLAVVTVGGVVNATPGSAATKVTLDPGNRVRVGDFLAVIAGWREAGPQHPIAWVLSTVGTSVTLTGHLDGVMIHDTVGLATLPQEFWLELRLAKMPDLRPGDEVLLTGLDRLQGQTESMFGIVEFLVPAENLVFLALEGSPPPFSIRPADLTASVLFVRGSALSLVQNQDLYVSWLACQNPDAMPRPCPEQTTPSGPCGGAVKS